MLTIYERSKGRKRSTPTRVGLAVAGGGPVGAVYELGSLRALEESIQGLRLHRLDTYVGVSAGAFIAASLANHIPCVEQCRVFMGVEHAELKFAPERFLKLAYREYMDRLFRLPRIVRDTIGQLLRHPLHASPLEFIAELSRVLPSGVFNNESIHDFLEDSFMIAGKGNRFEDLDCQLYVVAVDLDTGASVRFGTDENSEVPISKAVQASAALPGLYPPVQIGDRYYVDGALRRTLHASVALARGVDLLRAINPLVPYASNGSASQPHLKSNQLINSGLPLILSQTFRSLIQSRMQAGFAKYRNTHPSADLLLLEPDRDDEEMFFTNVFSYSSRKALAEHAYQRTREDLRAQADQLEPILEQYHLQLDRDALADDSRTLAQSINHTLESHTGVSRRLSRTLDDLEAELAGALAVG